ncbi:YbhB/YbcL family Raf kinase inhibitor-like protein [Thermomonospora amylolytica]|uniref:YbhB/YbcL family Raf kinase inhibitor-like protein n=1 Tax=Thermomonospora amylolytica TaxID=1411117 RepID=UPI001F2E1BFB|nr:YbhB/YbcL family Raf kinase inhibitor-like protein [Thermomonospora amylolytica]
MNTMNRRRAPFMRGDVPPHPPRAARALAAAATAVALAGTASGCGMAGPAMNAGVEITEFTVTSPAFHDGKELPARFACPKYPGGQGRTPPLRWSGAPSQTTRAFAIVMDDPDGSDGAHVGWVIVNIDGTTTELVEGARPDRAVEALNTSKKTAYVPPCPPRGERHRYRFTVYALSERLALGQGAPLKEALSTIAKYTVGRGRITGNFGDA